ncbi:DUF4402 domain-containing protein [Vibrio scophthalmi]|uniref:DUF4402 domain-containing protein n=1 Tax=Vibrio scophthalmi LMG 19158 TaxID=870967 RepID=F9RIV9_9VIBR|nr:DUF4402 domain-containing protein [Vibrio scophthalmi]EGU41871.1 hypothetical protein VIS19158_10709 [Vibrio scophthalmi LMG 19158]MCY9803396.1 DUF4402 domain-containing protein [Vibrio scophthalmi]
MKNLVKVVVASALALSAFQASALTEKLDITLNVKQPLTLVNTKALDFGTIFSTETQDQTIAHTDPKAAAFDVTGEAGSIVDVLVNGGNTVELDNAGNKLVLTFSNLDALTLTGGAAVLNVGGTVGVAGKTLSPGEYSAQVDVAVTYQ